jgi:cell wall-associated NlpC family hydrolase
VPGDIQKVVDYALGQVGDPYVWGAEGPDGFDCSGLVYAAFKAAGFDVQRTTAAVIGSGGGGYGHAMRNGADLTRARAGDVLYYDNPGPTDHVAIYLGNGQMIEAPQAGSPVRVTKARQPDQVRILQGGTVNNPETTTTNPLSDALGALNPFDGWQDSALRIGLTVLGGVAAAALVIVGAKEALNDKGTK